MLQVVQGRIQTTHTYIGNQECRNKFAKRSKSDKYAQDNNQLHLMGPNSFSFLWTKLFTLLTKRMNGAGPDKSR